ncbi:MAG: DUF4136 domain-containing protein [Acidobacteriota bacterium]
MRTLLVFSFFLILGSLEASAISRVVTDHDAEYSFSNAGTVVFLPTEAATEHETLVLNDLVRGRLERAIRDELSSKGFKLGKTSAAANTADLAIVFRAAPEELLEVDLHHGHRGHLVRSRRGSTLLIDLVTTSDRRLVWRATVENLLGLRNPTEKQVKRTIEKVFRRFPD